MKLLPVLEQLLKKCENDSVLLKDEILLLQLIVEKYTPQTADLLKLGSPFWEMLEKVLQQRTSVCIGHLSPMVTALGQVNTCFHSFFSLLFSVIFLCIVCMVELQLKLFSNFPWQGTKACPHYKAHDLLQNNTTKMQHKLFLLVDILATLF